MAKVTFKTDLWMLDGEEEAHAVNALIERGFIYAINEEYGRETGEWGYPRRAVLFNNEKQAQNAADHSAEGAHYGSSLVRLSGKHFKTPEEARAEQEAARKEKAAKEAAKAARHAEWAKKKADMMGLTAEEFERLRVLRKKASSCRSSAKKAAEAVAEAEKWFAKEQGYLQELEAEIAELEKRG